MNRALTRSSKYSPGNMAVEALESLFVARGDLLESTLNAIADTARSVATRYLLLVGPRGAGKTHFTSLLHHQLSAGSKFEGVRERSVIAYFNEEEWGIASYLDFLIRILVALDERSDGKLDAQLRDIRKLFTQSETTAIRAAEEALTEFVGSKRLILICENLNDLLEGLGTKGQQQWRSFTQQNPFWIVFATSPRISDDIQSQKAPFYGQFTIRYLERLRFEEAVELLIRKSKLDRKFELADFLNTATGRARVRAIHHLAGGNPRVYIVLSEFLTRESLDDLFEPFMQMADDLTPYYQDRLRQLAPRQRKIVEHLSRLSRPAKIKDIAEACLLSQQTASKQIHELAKQGYVLRIKAGRNTYVELTEPLMRICIEIKDNRTKHLRLFVEFLRHWFSAREIKKRCSSLAPGRNGISHGITIDNLWIAARVSESGFNGLAEAVKELQKDGKADLSALSWKGPFVDLLEQQYLQEGPHGIATTVSRLLRAVPVDGVDERIAEALTEFCFDGLGVEVFAAEGWDRALSMLKESLSDFESCSVALDFLGVAVEYSSSHDEEVLLQLPVEQRELLLTAFNDLKSD